MYHKVMIPLDGSELAEEALDYAIGLASQFRSHVHLLRVVPLTIQPSIIGLGGVGGSDFGTGVFPDEKVFDLQESGAEEYIQGVASRLIGEGIEVNCEVRRGVPAEEIVRSAKENGIDIIVISTHGRGGLGRLVFGSVADRVLKDSGKPLLVIKSKPKNLVKN